MHQISMKASSVLLLTFSAGVSVWTCSDRKKQGAVWQDGFMWSKAREVEEEVKHASRLERS